MAKDISNTSTDEDTSSVHETANLSSLKKVKRGKAPKRALKSEREKLKREQLNDLFNNLASILEITEPNNGKACVLGETIRLVSDISCQIKSLREQNQVLLSESDYVTAERNELVDETSTLKSQIEKIQREITEKKVPQSNSPFSSMIPPEYWEHAKIPMPMDIVKDPQFHHPRQLTDSGLQQQAPPIVGPLYMIPVGRSSDVVQAQPPPTTTEPLAASKLPSYVSKPHPRYPSPGDSWPLQLIQKQATETDGS